MIEFIVAVDPRPNTKARHFVSVAQALGRGLVRPCGHAENVTGFQPIENLKKSLIDLAYFDMPPSRSPTFFPEEPKVESPEEFALPPTLKVGHGDLLIHELRIVREGVFAHELLFSRGSVFVIEFADLEHRIQVI